MSRPALSLRTTRLALRPIEPGYVSFFHQLYADWRVAQCLLRTPAPFTEAHAQAFVEAAIAGLQQRNTYTLVTEQDAGKPVGLISLRIPAVDAHASRRSVPGMSASASSATPSCPSSGANATHPRAPHE